MSPLPPAPAMCGARDRESRGTARGGGPLPRAPSGVELVMNSNWFNNQLDNDGYSVVNDGYWFMVMNSKWFNKHGKTG